MQFTLITLVSLLAVAIASPISLSQPLNARTPAPAPVDAEAAAMTDASGNVVDFDTSSVYLAATAAGQ